MRKLKRESSLLRLFTNVGRIMHEALPRPVLCVAILAFVDPGAETERRWRIIKARLLSLRDNS